MHIHIWKRRRDNAHWSLLRFFADLRMVQFVSEILTVCYKAARGNVIQPIGGFTRQARYACWLQTAGVTAFWLREP